MIIIIFSQLIIAFNHLIWKNFILVSFCNSSFYYREIFWESIIGLGKYALKN